VASSRRRFTGIIKHEGNNCFEAGEDSVMIPALPTRAKRRQHASPGTAVPITSLHPLAARRVVPAWSWGRELLRDVAPVVIVTRLLFVLLTALTPLWRALTGSTPLRFVPATGTALDGWNRWDARWYDDIARLGYNLHGPTGFKNVAFFPLYPLLTRTLHDAIAAFFGNVLDMPLPDKFYPPYLVPGMLVANVCAVAALAFLYGLVRLDHGRPAARRTVTLLALCPPSIFLFAAYSEGTFLLCAIAFFYALRLERWWQAGLWGLLAAATRPPGIVLLAPFALAWVEGHPVVARTLADRLGDAWRLALTRARLRKAETPRPVPAAVRIDLYQRRANDSIAGSADANGEEAITPTSPRATRWHNRWRQWPEEARHAAHNGAPVVAIPLGLVLFMVFLGRTFNDPLWFSHAQQAWLRTFAPPWETLYISVAWPLGDLLHGTLTVVDFYALHDLLYEVAGLALTYLAWRRLPRTQGVYLWLVWLMLLSSPAMLTERHTSEPHHDVLMSLPRLLLMLFPLFTYLGLQRRLYRPLIVLFTIGLVVYTEIFLTGGWLS
jgi:hypothetical protein